MTGARLRDALAQADWDAPFRVAAYEPRRLVEHLDLLLHDRAHPHRVVMTTDLIEIPVVGVAHDIISHMAIRAGAKTIQCVRCVAERFLFVHLNQTNVLPWCYIDADEWPCGAH